ncbi:related to Salicylaldehyde dehydrogenase [Cephalotrichum gorgonifer]|uniref:Related to Salicylaldehyde dehydrogenase n=1 Tax=Cephalotrichum gorgonifer TaxID=2041049 RepID=A0AAE8N0F0_9PEZI|nr:related to Salicylaldehyde dehydrogenase [Cephalotrichum gorgonifer]
MSETSTLGEAQQLFINGEYRPSSDNAEFQVTNPMTGSPIYSCADATVQDVSDAIDSAHAAFKTWSRLGPSARRAIFLRAADILEGYMGGDAPEILRAEVSATEAWVRVNILATAGVLREAAGLATHIKGEIVPADRPDTTVLVAREALGVVFAISPWNAPVNLTARAIACPLICGNTVVLKPSEHSPKSQHLVIRALTAAGLPPGCVSFLPASPARAPEVTEHAVKHPLVRHVNFTGSERVGAIIAGWAASCLKKCVLELGGKAPVIVRADADLDNAVEAIVFGGLSNSGQICMSTERVIVHRDVMAEFREKLLARAGGLKCGNHLAEEGVSISGLFTPASATRVLGLVLSAVDAGATLLAGDLRIHGPNKTILRPHILEGVTSAMDLYHQESFGPVMILLEFGSDEEGVALANDSDFSLCASIFSRDVMRAMELAGEVRAGSCHINGPTVYIEATLPNGGVGGSSGYGRFGGMAGVEEFTERKIISLAKPGMKYNF